MIRTTTPQYVFVRDGMDWAEFFVHERRPLLEDGHFRYSATWSCVSSFGEFGHHWSHMGRPFATFIQTMSEDYLLGKIARQVFDEERLVSEVTRRIRDARQERDIDRKTSQAAMGAVRELRDQYSGEALASAMYENDDINAVQIEWSDVETRVWDPQAVAFVRKVWPKFVKAMAGRAAAEGSRTASHRRWGAYITPHRGERRRRLFRGVA